MIRPPQRVRDMRVRWDAYREARDLRPSFFERQFGWMNAEPHEIFGWTVFYSILSLTVGLIFWTEQTINVLIWIFQLLAWFFGLFIGLFREEETASVQAAQTSLNPVLILLLGAVAAFIWVNRRWMSAWAQSHKLFLWGIVVIPALVFAGIRANRPDLSLSAALGFTTIVVGIPVLLALLQRFGSNR
jgi:hypothetical protein